MQNTNNSKCQHIVIYGDGLAAQMTVAALATQAPPQIKITWIGSGNAAPEDVFYGGVTTPSAYDFNLAAGVAEPEVVLESDAAFSYGTRYTHWGLAKGNWIQSFHVPFPVIDGVLFNHYLSQQGIYELEPFLTSAIAAKNGAFAHPPEGGGTALSRAEYGYQFDSATYGALFEKSAGKNGVKKIVSEISRIESESAGIRSIVLADGQTLTADLYIDCSGPQALLLSSLKVSFQKGRRIAAVAEVKAAAGPGAPVRTISGNEFGWTAETPLQNGVALMSVFDPESQGDIQSDLSKVEVTLGCREAAWSGNCVAIGQAAGVLEPLTPAPMVLLQRDIERLLSLLPITREMSVERREFNRLYADDFDHADLFNRSLFEGPDFPDTPYWRAARHLPADEKLTNKIAQFESRGLHVAYDLEPFNQEDWTIMHYGMGRRPARYDRIADQASPAKVGAYLANMRREIDETVKAMPSHRIYMEGLTRFLKQQNGLRP
ncbi:MAG TPA: tryptophan 7-halogenase [Asticcacaulis sp.]|nr:tryptophan 7-halogenase [Asticcacaulis sp.]